MKIPPQNPGTGIHLILSTGGGLPNGFPTSERSLSIANTELFLSASLDTGDPGERPLRFGIQVETKPLFDEKWHHVAYSYYLGSHGIYIDGKPVYQSKGNSLKMVGNSIIAMVGDIPFNSNRLQGNALLDDVGIFEIGFSEQDIQNIYNQPLSNFINAMPIDPQGKVATTWGKIKSQ